MTSTCHLTLTPSAPTPSAPPRELKPSYLIKAITTAGESFYYTVDACWDQTHQFALTFGTQQQADLFLSDLLRTSQASKARKGWRFNTFLKPTNPNS